VSAWQSYGAPNATANASEICSKKNIATDFQVVGGQSRTSPIHEIGRSDEQLTKDIGRNESDTALITRARSTEAAIYKKTACDRHPICDKGRTRQIINRGLTHEKLTPN
jgi:hypothetical protein